ncbi:hypothetical protein D915_005685 [Fasciola hepatica]|uniref:Uncharacterized protein n=1 Tax=Fasciola hepatica TaxID=6192 RepID=A0A4E0RY19_FASHE|nr:hypothetical protein D915_005685 [Fasciola hepatica]
MRSHRKQVYPSSPIPMHDGTDGNEATVVTLNEKKPTPSRIAIATAETGGSTVTLDSAAADTAAASSLLSSSNLGTGGSGTDAPPVALAAAAAMPGTLLTATGAAVAPGKLVAKFPLRYSWFDFNLGTSGCNYPGSRTSSFLRSAFPKATHSDRHLKCRLATANRGHTHHIH